VRHGGSPATESAVGAALAWLARHQRTDGSWQRHGLKQEVSGAFHTTAVTSLALLAFLGAGHTERVGTYRHNVRLAVKYLISRQTESGLIESPGYTHAIAGLAMAEAAGMGRLPGTRAAAHKAVNYSTGIHQQGAASARGAWRYRPKMDPDLSVSGWFVMQLKSAREAGLRVPSASFEGAERFLNSVERVVGDEAHPAEVVRTYGYQEPDHGPRTTPIGLLCRQFMGWPRERLEGGVKYMVETDGPPTWGKAGRDVDLYRWYYGTLCVFQQGGEVWNRWNTALKKALLENQRRDGPLNGGLKDKHGSWDPVGVKYADAWARVGQTALAALCLEVYYRYLPMYR
jgi:hypothetical protein